MYEKTEVSKKTKSINLTFKLVTQINRNITFLLIQNIFQINLILTVIQAL